MKKTFKIIALLLVAGFSSIYAIAQEETSPASPPAMATGKIKDATITINYSSPEVKGRSIWGGLEKYDKVWRAGANKTTTFETDRAITVQGQILPAGKYNFFLIPKESGIWTAIFNKEISNTDPFSYKQAEDQLRVEVKTKPLKETQERLIYKVNKLDFTLEWDKIAVPIAVK